MPKKILNGKELQSYIKERQLKQSRGLLQQQGVKPKMAILIVGEPSGSIKLYVGVKQKYGEDIEVDVEVINVDDINQAKTAVENLNNDKNTHGIIVQLPMADEADPQELLDTISPNKDIDGLSSESNYEPATSNAVLWLLNGYNIELAQGKKIAIVGQGRLVGKPLFKAMSQADYLVEAIDNATPNPNEIIAEADIIITATGQPALITSDIVKNNAIVVDAGVAEVNGQQVGDVDDSVYERDDLTITPKNKGGVGPLTVSALFDNLLIAASNNQN